MRKLTILFLFVFVTFSVITLAQDTSKKKKENFKVPMSLGLYGGLNINMHQPSFPRGSSYIHFFEDNQTSYTGNIGLIGLFPIDDILVMTGRLGYNPTSVDLISTTGEQKYEMGLGYFEISPVLQFHNLLPIKPLYFLAGLEFGIPVDNEYKFINNNVPNDSGNISPASMRAAFVIGAGYMFKISGKFYVSPELSYRFPFTRVTSDADFSTWKVSQLRLGVNLTFSLEGKPKAKPIPPAGIDMGFKEVRYYNPDGTTAPVQSVKVEDVQYSELYPFIPYIFLDKNTIEPQEDEQIMIGKTESGEFTIQKLEPDAMKINMSTLDIIGTRMERNSNAELAIVGTIDGSDEKDSKDLALMRAVYAKDYLVENFDIDPKNITVKGEGIPQEPSSLRDPDGIAENRRIEFYSNTPDLFKPILIQSENQRIANPALIEFVPYANSEDSIITWTMEITQADRLLRKNKGLGVPPAMQWAIRPNELTNKQVPIDYKLIATTINGVEKSITGSIPIEYYSTKRKKTEDLPDRVVSKFSLILFDFDKAEISKEDKKIIDEYIIPTIKYNSTIKIYGYTDRIGDDKYNQKLARRRAEAVKDYIKKKKKDVKIDVYGVGESVPIFDNNKPIGRQLSRTVQVHVITPK
jgi:outer membrane protein OmpA-like peptidoglycan-associated protein